MKLISSLLFVLLLSFPFIFADKVGVTYSTSTPIVADIPFPLTVNLNTNSMPTLSYNLFVTSTDGKLIFLDAYKGNLFSSNDIAASSPLEGGKLYRFQVKPKVGYDGVSKDAQSLFVVNTKLQGLVASSSQLKLDATGKVHVDNKITPSENGKSAEITQTPFLITPQPSSCGDGVVGYIDDGVVDKSKANNGVKDAGEVNEVCDTSYFDAQGIKQPNVGCNSDCKYIQKEYRVKGFKTLGEKQSCDFGSYSCELQALPARDLFLAKVGALLDGKCFPYNEHKDADYCEGGKPMLVLTPDGKVKSEDRVFVISRIGAALTDLFNSIIS